MKTNFQPVKHLGLAALFLLTSLNAWAQTSAGGGSAGTSTGSAGASCGNTTASYVHTSNPPCPDGFDISVGIECTLVASDSFLSDWSKMTLACFKEAGKDLQTFGGWDEAKCEALCQAGNCTANFEIVGKPPCGTDVEQLFKHPPTWVMSANYHLLCNCSPNPTPTPSPTPTPTPSPTPKIP